MDENTISENTLKMVDSSMESLAEGKAGEPVDLNEFKELTEDEE